MCSLPTAGYTYESAPAPNGYHRLLLLQWPGGDENESRRGSHFNIRQGRRHAGRFAADLHVLREPGCAQS